MPPNSPRISLDADTYADQDAALYALVAQAGLPRTERAQISTAAAKLVRDIRDHSDPGLMEVFLAEYGLSTDEGVALMCLAEALLRVPDAETIDALIEDKIAASDWGKHLGHSTSSLVNASTWALMLTGRVLQDDMPGPIGHLRGAIKRLGEPVIRTAVARAMKEMGHQFVLGETIDAAMERAAKMEAKGYTYSYDMLGEAARTDGDAKRYHLSYSRAISAIATACSHSDIRSNPGISVKLSALHPRYETAQEDRVMAELVPRLRSLALIAKSAGMGLNIDAEEADRLSLSLEVVGAVLGESALAGWDGLGVVVQAYGPRAGKVIDRLYQMAHDADRKIMVRLVKGAYWDTEIKHAQVEGMNGFPVFTQKAATDVSYIANARKLLGMTDRIYPQFATHNAHTVAAILHMADASDTFEFQRLHGMGEALHGIVLNASQTRCRIYAPVGAHRDLLAYLVRRLLENGANSSFVNQIVDETVPPETVAADPFDQLGGRAASIPTGPELFQPERPNSRGFDLAHAPTLAAIETARTPFRAQQWAGTPLLAGSANPHPAQPLVNPANPADCVGTIAATSADDIETALGCATPWAASPAERGRVLGVAADLYEENHGEIFALLAREAGKNLPDCVSELREAVDFLRYYGVNAPETPAAGLFACISPWNFPLAIFSGQIGAALAAGNAVLAKPAEQTPLTAHLAVTLLHKAGVPVRALQLLPGKGDIGAALTSDARINGIAFTGSTATALKIRAAMADNLTPGTPLIAETGGLNAMIVDSTALPEQAVGAVIESAFQSAGQRCSALRCLYVQKDIADSFTEMLVGAMLELSLGSPWAISTDCGPVIDTAAQADIAAHIEIARQEGRIITELAAPANGSFIAPTLIRVDGIGDLAREIFGPVLHIATFNANELDTVVDDINATGYGLTFGLQTRIDDRVQHVSDRICAGNIYINRNQIGAIVGSQPFGGEGLSGTGPKAGGPNYLPRFGAPDRQNTNAMWGRQTDLKKLRIPLHQPRLIETITLPGPTGESNRLGIFTRPPLLCLGPGVEVAQSQADKVISLGGKAIVASGSITPSDLTTLNGISGVLWWGGRKTGREMEQALARRDGPIIPLIAGDPAPSQVQTERHICVDTTAAGGNTALLGGV